MAGLFLGPWKPAELETQSCPNNHCPAFEQGTFTDHCAPYCGHREINSPALKRAHNPVRKLTLHRRLLAREEAQERAGSSLPDGLRKGGVGGGGLGQEQKLETVEGRGSGR